MTASLAVRTPNRTFTMRDARTVVSKPPAALCCPLCDHDPLDCMCAGTPQDSMTRLLESDTLASYTPNGWTHVETSVDDGPTVDCAPPDGRLPSWRINAATLRVIPNAVYARFVGAASKRVL